MLFYILVFFVIIVIVVVLIFQYLEFKSLYKIECEQPVSELEYIIIKPTILKIDEKTKIYSYYYISLFGIIFTTKRIKCISFTIINNVIKYKSE